MFLKKDVRCGTVQFTNRQLFILSYLLNHPEGISGEHLASQINVSLRTLQNEIQEINRNAENSLTITSSGKQGYTVQGVTQQIRDNLLNQAGDRQSIYMPEERVNDILTVLLFAQGYTNMEALANTLYLSKASVFRTIDTSYPLQKYVTVNRTKGLLIDLPEREKRQILAKVFDKDAQNPIARRLRQDYTHLDMLLRIALINLFTRHHYSVSGEALRSFRRYLIISILRSKEGYSLEETNWNLPISSLMKEIIATVRSVIGIQFSDWEIQDCQSRLNNLCTFLHDIPDHRKEWITDWAAANKRFIEEIRNRFGIQLEMSQEDEQRFLLHVYKLYQRVQVGQHDSNYHTREINRSYPMSVHLILLTFEEIFGFPVPETEVGYLAMYLAVPLRKFFKRIDCIIVTAKNPSVAWPMKKWMEEHFTRHLRSVTIVEHYRFNQNMAWEDMLVLTTGETVALSCPQAILVKPFNMEAEYDLIDKRIQKIRSQYKEDC